MATATKKFKGRVWTMRLEGQVHHYLGFDKAHDSAPVIAKIGRGTYARMYALDNTGAAVKELVRYLKLCKWADLSTLEVYKKQDVSKHLS